MTTDHLGSTRVVTGQDQSVKGRYDYLPFGEALGAGLSGRTPQMGYDAQVGLRQKFTQKERDGESGLDYFLARYYSAAQGRFTSVDMALVFGNPQSLNRYQYGFNNPLRYIDPDGNFAIEGLVNTLTDFVIGVARGYSASVTGGLYPGSTPTEKDSNASLVGQIVGTMIAANHGAGIAGSGATLEIGSMGTGTAVAVPVAAFGYAMVAGAAGNLVRIGDAVLNKSSSGEGGEGGGQPERRAGQDVEVRPAGSGQEYKPELSTNQRQIMKRLGLTKLEFRRGIHRIKKNIPGNPDVQVDLKTGNVYDPRSNEFIGNLLDYKKR